jgi:hypothetical protein
MAVAKLGMNFYQTLNFCVLIPCRILTVEEKKKIGHLCKLLIDQGRLQYLQQKGFSPALQYYTDPLVSLENVLLTAVPAHPSSQEKHHQ